MSPFRTPILRCLSVVFAMVFGLAGTYHPASSANPYESLWRPIVEVNEGRLVLPGGNAGGLLAGDRDILGIAGQFALGRSLEQIDIVPFNPETLLEEAIKRGLLFGLLGDLKLTQSVYSELKLDVDYARLQLIKAELGVPLSSQGQEGQGKQEGQDGQEATIPIELEKTVLLMSSIKAHLAKGPAGASGLRLQNMVEEQLRQSFLLVAKSLENHQNIEKKNKALAALALASAAATLQDLSEDGSSVVDQQVVLARVAGLTHLKPKDIQQLQETLTENFQPSWKKALGGGALAGMVTSFGLHATIFIALLIETLLDIEFGLEVESYPGHMMAELMLEKPFDFLLKEFGANGALAYFITASFGVVPFTILFHRFVYQRPARLDPKSTLLETLHSGVDIIRSSCSQLLGRTGLSLLFREKE